jgi:hypothetical protein
MRSISFILGFRFVTFMYQRIFDCLNKLRACMRELSEFEFRQMWVFVSSGSSKI